MQPTWETFEAGVTNGQSGSEDGIIIRDEIYARRARITLESETPIAPFAITCGIFGWMVHTRYFGTRAQADAEFAKMQKELARIANLLRSNSDDPQAEIPSNLPAEFRKFIKRFP